jgi:hypothetical protein
MTHYADMLTDSPTRKAGLAAFKESDRIRTLHLPENGSLVRSAKSIEAAMKAGKGADVRCSVTNSSIQPLKSLVCFREDMDAFYASVDRNVEARSVISE